MQSKFRFNSLEPDNFSDYTPHEGIPFAWACVEFVHLDEVPAYAETVAYYHLVRGLHVALPGRVSKSRASNQICRLRKNR